MTNTDSGTKTAEHADEIPADWKAIISEHQKPHAGRATWQLVNSVGTYALVWWLMYLCIPISWWLVIPLAVLAGALAVRVFIIFHDCGHGSFFRSRLANDIWGFITGMLVFTPYHHWRWEHAVHHATNGDLDRRGVGDVWTLTVEEYLNASGWKRFSYRLVRNPIVLFVIAPLFLFAIRERFPTAAAKSRDKISVWVMNIALIAMSAALISVFGFLPWLLIQLTVLGVAGSAGVWLFYVQHQFEDTYWQRNNDWDFVTAAMKGSSYYKLPRILQWFSGNIGYHHIHHLNSRIPNYNLERCHRSHPMFSEVPPLTLWQSFKSLKFRLWDEEAMKLISFGELKKQLQQRAGSSHS
jgi:omega-6 fatty acid desaturase (delta-12 desaturase)